MCLLMNLIICNANGLSIIVIKPKYRILASAVPFISTDYCLKKMVSTSHPSDLTENILLPTPMATTHHVSTLKSTARCVDWQNLKIRQLETETHIKYGNEIQILSFRIKQR